MPSVTCLLVICLLLLHSYSAQLVRLFSSRPLTRAALLLCFGMYMCTWCVFTCVNTHPHMCGACVGGCIWGCLKFMPGACFDCSPLHSGGVACESQSSPVPASLDSGLALEILSLLPKCWDYSWTTVPAMLFCGAADLNQTSFLHNVYPLSHLSG